MTTEEKAKRYDEALERAKSWHTDAQIDFKKSLENLFPELKESEDEKIRKEILEYFQQFENEDLRGIDISDWIAWLEKQGQKPYIHFKADDWYVSKVDGKIRNIYYSCDGQDNLEKQKPIEWSEEDERIRKSLIDYFGRFDARNEFDENIEFGKVVDWLKKQKPLGWSDEDEKIRKTLIEYFNICSGDYYGELKKCDILAWLEKQKNLTDEEYEQGKKDVLWCINKAAQNAKDENEMGTCWFAEKWLEKQKPKPVEWTEEDELMLENAIIPHHMTPHDYNKFFNWIKTLKQRLIK